MRVHCSHGKSSISLILLVALSIFAAILPFNHANATAPVTITRTVSEDSYIDPWHNKTAYGLSNILNASTSISNLSTIIFLKFDISGLPPNSQVKVTGVNLTLSLVNSSLQKNDVLAAYQEYNNTWSEKTLTYANAPRGNISPVPNDPKFPGTGSTSWNVTNLVKGQLGVNSTISIVLHHYGPSPPSNTLILFKSNDWVPYSPPTLTIAYQSNESSIATSVYPRIASTFGFPVIINSTVRTTVNGTVSYPKSGTVAIQFSVNNGGWSNIMSAPPGINGSVTAVWIPPIAGNYTIRSTWSGDQFTQNATSQPQSLSVTKASTTTSVLVTPSTIGYGNQTLVIATVRPQTTGATIPQFSDSPLLVEYSSDSGANWAQFFSTSPTNGIAFQTFNPPAKGSYLFRASWLGDNNYNPSYSAIVPLTVTEAPTVLTFSASQTILEVGSSNVLYGVLKASGGAAINGAKVVIQISPASSSSSPLAFTDLTTLTTGIDGSFSFPWVPQTNGTYQLRAYFTGTTNYDPSTSRVQQVLVGASVFPTVGEISLLSGLLGFFIGLGLSFLVRFRRSVGVKRRQRYGGTRTKGEQPQ